VTNRHQVFSPFAKGYRASGVLSPVTSCLPLAHWRPGQGSADGSSRLHEAIIRWWQALPWSHGICKFPLPVLVAFASPQWSLIGPDLLMDAACSAPSTAKVTRSQDGIRTLEGLFIQHRLLKVAWIRFHTEPRGSAPLVFAVLQVHAIGFED